MALRIVRLGSPRQPQEGLRLGTVRRPPRGVPKDRFAAQDWYDVWFPTLAPSAELLQQGQKAESAAQWKAFERAYRREMTAPAAQHALDLLARLSQQSNFSLGCYCEDESRCHRSVLRQLLRARDADVID